MDFEQRMEEALNRVYGALGESRLERSLKNMAGQLSLENIESINEQIEQHYNQKSFTNKQSK